MQLLIKPIEHTNVNITDHTVESWRDCDVLSSAVMSLNISFIGGTFLQKYIISHGESHRTVTTYYYY